MSEISPGFLETIYPQKRVIALAGSEQTIVRSRLGVHVQLERLSAHISRNLMTGRPREAAASIKEYLTLAGVAISEQATGSELLLVYHQLQKLNTVQCLAAFMMAKAAPSKPVPYDYPGRPWVLWIHKFASRYGWTPDEVWNLWPEEAAWYMQEILVSEYDEADARRALSSVTYKYNKSTKRYSWRPLPRPAWMVRDEAKPRRVRKDMLPVGKIIKLE